MTWETLTEIRPSKNHVSTHRDEKQRGLGSQRFQFNPLVLLLVNYNVGPVSYILSKNRDKDSYLSRPCQKDQHYVKYMAGGKALNVSCYHSFYFYYRFYHITSLHILIAINIKLIYIFIIVIIINCKKKLVIIVNVHVSICLLLCTLIMLSTVWKIISEVLPFQ